MKATHNERVKLTAAYLNTAAGACRAAGLVAPLAAAIFGYAAGGVGSTLTFAIGMTTFLAAPLALHAAARNILKGLRP